jgi:hypothetical protein
VPQFRPMLADLGFSYLNLILGRTHSAVSPGGTTDGALVPLGTTDGASVPEGRLMVAQRFSAGSEFRGPAQSRRDD